MTTWKYLLCRRCGDSYLKKSAGNKELLEDILKIFFIGSNLRDGKEIMANFLTCDISLFFLFHCFVLSACDRFLILVDSCKHLEQDFFQKLFSCYFVAEVFILEFHHFMKDLFRFYQNYSPAILFQNKEGKSNSVEKRMLKNLKPTLTRPNMVTILMFNQIFWLIATQKEKLRLFCCLLAFFFQLLIILQVSSLWQGF